MRIRLSAAHRDALYEQILDRLSGIGDLWVTIDSEDYETATRLGWEVSDSLRLILEDLGWGRGPGRSIDLTCPPDVLLRLFAGLRETAVRQGASEAAEWADSRASEERNRLVTEACDTVLTGLAGGSGRSVTRRATGSGPSHAVDSHP